MNKIRSELMDSTISVRFLEHKTTKKKLEYAMLLQASAFDNFEVVNE